MIVRRTRRHDDEEESMITKVISWSERLIWKIRESKIDIKRERGRERDEKKSQKEGG